MTTRILAVDDSPIILKLLAATLAKTGYQVSTASNGVEALRQVDQVHPDLVILDVMMPEMDGYEVCRRLRRNPSTAQLPVIMLTAQSTVEEKIKGYESGADQWVTKPFDPAELHARIEVLLRRTGQAPNAETNGVGGKTIAVFSLRGGVGVSTVAANLAVGLTQIWGTPSVLVDLALTAGHSALFLNVSPRTTWGNLASIALNEMDAEVLNQVLLSHANGTRVLAAPRRAEQAGQLTPELVTGVLTMLSQRYRYVVLDLPHDFHDLTLAGLDRADEILVLLTPDLPSVLNASSALDVFDSLGYPQDKIRLALNCIVERRSLSRAEVEAALKRPMNILIPFAPDTVGTAISEGVPFVLDKPASEIGALLEDLAFYFSQAEQRDRRPATPSPAWVRVSNRMQQRNKK